jgi:hypothetical protein
MYGNAKESVKGLFFFNKYTSFLNKFVLGGINLSNPSPPIDY